MINCDKCINSIIIEDNNGYNVCTSCGIVCSFDKVCDTGTGYTDKSPKYSVYDEGFDWDTAIDTIKDQCSLSVKYNQKYKEYCLTIQNYCKNPTNLFPDDLLQYIYTEIKKEEQFIKKYRESPSKKNTFRLFGIINLNDTLKLKYKSRINNKELDIKKRKNLITKWFQVKRYILEKENFQLNGINNLLPDIIGELLKKCFSCFITEYFIIIGRNTRIASPNSIVLTLCYLYLFNPKYIIEYSNLFDIPTRKTTFNNLDIIIKIWKYKFLNFNAIRYYIKSIINENFRKNDFLNENILNINYEEENNKFKEWLMISKKYVNNITLIEPIIISLNQMNF